MVDGNKEKIQFKKKISKFSSVTDEQNMLNVAIKIMSFNQYIVKWSKVVFSGIVFAQRYTEAGSLINDFYFAFKYF